MLYYNTSSTVYGTDITASDDDSVIHRLSDAFYAKYACRW